MNNVTCGTVCTARCESGYIPVDGRPDDTEELFVCGHGVWDRVISMDEHGSKTAPFACHDKNPPDPNEILHTPVTQRDSDTAVPATTAWASPLDQKFDPVSALWEVLGSKRSLEIEQIEEISCGEAVQAKPGDKLTVHYQGTLKASGIEFDSSYARGKPIVFRIGSGQVIKGWDQGIVGMCVGEKRLLTVPPHLGYGGDDRPRIPPSSTLVFVVELMGINL